MLIKDTTIKWCSSVLFWRWGITRYAVLAFLVPLAIRAIPEFLMGSWPAGFDVVTYYAPYMLDVKRYGLVKPFFDIVQSQTAPLTYTFVGLVAYLIPIDSLFLAKVLSPIIYGFLGFAIYMFVKNGLSWTSKRALLATMMMTMYFVTLRLSWDMWKNTLGLAFFLLATCHVKKEEYWKFAGFSFLCILVHELMAVMLVSVLVVVVFYDLVKRSSSRTRLSIFALVGLLALFGTGYYMRLIRVFPQPQPDIPKELLTSGRAMSIPYNYLGARDWYGYQSANYARLDACMLMLKMYGPIFPLALLGWRRDVWIDSYTAISALPFLSVVLMPSMAIPAWHRFAFLLTIPLTLYAANFLIDKGRLRRFFLIFLAIFMVGYLVLPPESAFPYYGLFPSTYRYLPASMLQNSVSIEDLTGVADSFRWLNNRLRGGDCLLAPEAYIGWARLLIDDANITIIPYNLSAVTPPATKKYYDNIYLVWWNRNVNWYSWSPSIEFEPLSQNGRIVVYEYAGNAFSVEGKQL